MGKRKRSCRTCGLFDEMCLCVAKAYIEHLELRIAVLENEQLSEQLSRPPVVDPYAKDRCVCKHLRNDHSKGVEINNFQTKCFVTGCSCSAYQLRPPKSRRKS